MSININDCKITKIAGSVQARGGYCDTFVEKWLNEKIIRPDVPEGRMAADDCIVDCQ